MNEYDTYGFKVGDIVINKGAANYDEKRRIIGVLAGKSRVKRCDGAGVSSFPLGIITMFEIVTENK